ncbi:MAG: (Fe-S)-binding protein [Methanomassiliicoccales archaeon]|nr:(Fe-S)-binding protein [Methanomassiliicoccales archaeon]
MSETIDAPNLRKMRKELMTCTYCGFCKSVCPPFQKVGWDPSVARGRMVLAYGLLQKEIPADPSVLEYLYQCTTCKDCERRCPSKISVVDVVESARRDLVAAGHMLPRHKTIVEKVERTGNAYGEGKDVPETLGSKPHKAKVSYFVGCTATYRDRALADSTISILNKLGEDYTLLDEVCCGSVLQRIGVDEDEVEKLWERNVKAIRSLGVEKVIFSCAGCYRMFKEEYPKRFDLGFEVQHVTEYLAGKDLKLRPLKATVTYHDPCHLGRHCGVYDAPRQVLQKIPDIQFKEMPRNRDTAACCGGGGGVRSAYPDLSKAIAGRRVEEAAFADLLVTTCPFCVNNLKAGAEGKDAPEIVDLVQLVDRLL